MSEIIIRPAEIVDIPALCALERECFSLPWSEKSFEDFFSLDCTLAFVAEVGERTVGYAGMYLSYGDGDITNVAVTSEFRRRGIGARLVCALAEAKGVERLLLEVRESNQAARALYTRLGFTEDGKRRGFYQNPREDAILMSLVTSNSTEKSN